jgi:hypothetical protein
LLVVSMASPSKSAAKHMIIIPTTTLSIFMNSYFGRRWLIIFCLDCIWTFFCETFARANTITDYYASGDVSCDPLFCNINQQVLKDRQLGVRM